MAEKIQTKTSIIPFKQIINLRHFTRHIRNFEKQSAVIFHPIIKINFKNYPLLNLR